VVVRQAVRWPGYSFVQLDHHAGAQVQDDVKDADGGRLIASVRDADGSITGLMHDS
jgi:hypothetical protein